MKQISENNVYNKKSKKIMNLNYFKIQYHLVLVFAIAMWTSFKAQAQPVPSIEENIPFLVTFGPKAETLWGDNDFSQIWFFQVPETYKGLVYIRVFDPDVGGMYDEVNGVFDTRMLYSVYGGKDSFTHPDMKEVNPKKNYKTGNLLASKVFGVDSKFDNNWYTFGPFDPTKGEYYPRYGSYIFKVICEGIEGDDGNMYRYFMSTSATENIPIEGGNAFTYEYTFRLHNDPKQISHIYPYVDTDVIKIKTENFDWDNDGNIRVTSEVRREQMINVSGDNVWATTEFYIKDEEKGKSLDFQFIKRTNPVVNNNNVVITVRNQYGELMKFYSSPIGGVPKFKYTIDVQKKPKQ